MHGGRESDGDVRALVLLRKAALGELGGIDAHLVGAVGVDADEFHVVTADDRVQRASSDVPGGPLDDAQRSGGGPGYGGHDRQGPLVE